MAYIVKPMRIQLVSNSDGTGLLEELGSYAYVIQESNTIVNSYWQGNAADIIARYNAFGIDNELAGNILLNPVGNSVTRYQTIAPLTREITISQTGYLKLVSSNGYYAVSFYTVSASTSPSTSIWKLYDNDDNEVSSCVWTMGLPATFGEAIANIVTSSITDGIISSQCAGLELIDFSSAWRLSMQPLNLTTAQLNWINGVSSEPFPTDPYEQGGTSTTGGGTGNFDLSSDAIDFPGLPTLSAVSTGLISLYTPTITQLNALASYLWNADVTTVDWWKKLVANPLDLILGLSIVPVAAPQGSSNNIKVGLIDTGVSMPRCASQYVEVDCGSLNVSEFWGSALDYAPFRKHSIYLPFIGTRSINTDDIMGKTVSVVYHIDLLSGAATAMIKAGESVLYQYSGACAISVPLSGQTFTDMITSTIQLAAAIGATVATGGAAAGITAASAANSVMSMKPTIERAGGVSGAAGQLGIMTPYLIGEIPRQSVPKNYNQFAGYPSNIKSVLGELSGYTEVETVYLTNIIATSGELGEIESLLKQGVFINES